MTSMTEPPVTDNERPIFVDGIGPPLQQLEQDYQPSDDNVGRGRVCRDVLALIAEVKRFVAALSAATTQRDEALAQVGAATTILAEAEKILPGVITTAGRFSIGLNDRERAIAAEGRAEGLAAQLQQTREALQRAQSLHAEQLQAIDDGDDFGEHVGIVRHRRAVYQGQAEIISLWEDALAAAAPATTLDEPEDG